MREKHLLFPTQEMGGKTQNSGPHLLVLYGRTGGIHMVKDNGSGQLGWLLNRERSSWSTQIIGTIGLL
jgi:hypothetical protein